MKVAILAIMIATVKTEQNVTIMFLVTRRRTIAANPRAIPIPY